MSKLSLGNIFLFMFLVSVVWMTSIVAAKEKVETCTEIWDDEDCKRGNPFSNCRINCEEKYGPYTYGAGCLEYESFCVCSHIC
ncbi:hypothetical protein AAHE18_09G021200 [Arachis hypogaea]|nr:uncharacterized protein DS421_9g255600 [Arachis hypogaea]